MTPFWSGVGGGAQESVTLVLVEATRLRFSGGLVGTVDIGKGVHELCVHNSM